MVKSKQVFYTSQVARAANVHPNTVRLYEEWGFLQPVPRAPNGYRLFNQEHVDQMCFARLALHGEWPGHKIKRSALELVKRAASGDLGGALEQSYDHLALVHDVIEAFLAVADHNFHQIEICTGKQVRCKFHDGHFGTETGIYQTQFQTDVATTND